MHNIIDILREKVSEAIVKIFHGKLESFSEFLPAEITQTAQKQFGSYQCNSSLKLAKALKISPREVATLIVKELADAGASEMIDKVEIAGPGFINFFLKTSFLSKELMHQLADSRLGVPLPHKKQKVVIDFSSPNIAKELHVGHLRSTIIGESLARLLEFLGHHVLRLNHVGDWGTQFGMLIAYLKRFNPEVLEGSAEPQLSQLMHWYKASKKIFDEESAFKRAAQEEVGSLQSLSKDSLAAWTKICDISRKAFKEIYELLDVSLEERGESFYNPLLPYIIHDLEEKDLIKIDQGAKCVFLDGFYGMDKEPLPMIIQKSDGGYNYSTTDMAAIKHRVQVEKADRIIYVVDAGQSLHFQMIFKLAEKIGYVDPAKVKLDHVAFGVVLGADGKKFKTRSGETEKLIDLINEAVEKAAEILKEKMPEVTEELLQKRAHILGIDAIKYADLSCHRLKDYVFSYDRMLRFEGNTAAFLLYAFVRIQSIKQKCQKNSETLAKNAAINIEHPSEFDLGLHLRQFGEVLQVAEQELLPHKLCDYLYQLAEYFHAFFRDCRVEGSEEENSRLLLCELTAKVLEKGLSLLGLKTLDRM